MKETMLMTPERCLDMVREGGLDFVDKLLDPSAGMWTPLQEETRSRRRAQAANPANSVVELHAEDEDAKALSAAAFHLVEWVLAGGDPVPWMDNLRQSGSTSTCNHVCCSLVCSRVSSCFSL